MKLSDKEMALRLLPHVDPGACSYTGWTEVGMALKEAGLSVREWDEWSRRDMGRYHEGECARKWETFRGSGKPVTVGTIYHMAIEQGWTPTADIEAGMLGFDGSFTVDTERGWGDTGGWLEPAEINDPGESWKPAEEMIEYFRTLFEPGEVVGYVVKSWKNEKGKYVPKDKGVYTKTAGELIEKLSKCWGDVGSVLGDYDPEGGAWVRFNPLDGEGVRNANVSEFRYALVESDSLTVENQVAMYEELRLPVAILVHSGGKSAHAIVRVDAPDYAEYRKRVDYLYGKITAWGAKHVPEGGTFSIDTQNKNPSRLSRLPGVMRGGKRQYIIRSQKLEETKTHSWEEWKDYIEGVDDHLPDVSNLESMWDHMPDKPEPLIDGVLRRTHKMLITGASKTGKSFLQTELAIAIAEGGEWLGFRCSQGRVLYVNLEIDEASCFHRFRDVYEALGYKDKHLKNIDIWNLRGQTEALDTLVPKLIRRMQRAVRKDDGGYAAVIIDPIYKVITGDENSASDMAKFCNQFDKICKATNAAAIYCHHHSKGAQGGKKSMDRASGSGVFGRDPDALIDLTELPLNKDRRDELVRNETIKAAESWLLPRLKEAGAPDEIRSQFSQALDCSGVGDYLASVREAKDLTEEQRALVDSKELAEVIRAAREAAESMTALRIEGTLREFAAFRPRNVYFRHPIHIPDETGTLADIDPEVSGRAKGWRNTAETNEKKKTTKDKNLDKLQAIYKERCNEKYGLTVTDELAKEIGVSLKTLRSYIKEDLAGLYEWHGKTKESDGRVEIAPGVKAETFVFVAFPETGNTVE
jgi:RecA-family ATPase